MNIVSVMAHQDDEMNCLGTMLIYKNQGHKLHFITVTDGSGGMVQDPDMSREEAAEIRNSEMEAVAKACDAGFINLREKDEFLYDNEKVRYKLVDAIRAVKADVLFTHFSPDYNLDHTTVNSLVRQCIMHAPLPMMNTDHKPISEVPAVFMCEPVGSFDFQPTHYVDISSVKDEKVKILKLHKSQQEAIVKAFGPDAGFDNRITDAFRGYQTGIPYAEGFVPMLTRFAVKSRQVLP